MSVWMDDMSVWMDDKGFGQCFSNENRVCRRINLNIIVSAEKKIHFLSRSQVPQRNLVIYAQTIIKFSLLFSSVSTWLDVETR